MSNKVKENIITTQDDLYRSHYKTQQFISHSAKDVHNYAKALETGFVTITRSGLLPNNVIIEIHMNERSTVIRLNQSRLVGYYL